MPLGESIYRVKALTTTPTFLDYYLQRGGDYNPEVGEIGYMYRTEAYDAETAGDVLVHFEHTPVEMVRNVPRELEASAHVPGNGEAEHIVFIQPGIYDGGANGTGYTITVTMAIDGGGDLTAVTTAAVEGATSEEAATDLAGQVVAGVTITQEASNPNNVIFQPDAGAFTTFTVAIADSAVAAAAAPSGD